MAIQQQVSCPQCGRQVLITPEVNSRNHEITNAGHGNILGPSGVAAIIQCACGRQIIR